MRSEDESANGSYSRLADVQSLLDEGRAEHEKRGEAAKDNVHQVRFVNRQVVPRHLVSALW